MLIVMISFANHYAAEIFTIIYFSNLGIIFHPFVLY